MQTEIDTIIGRHKVANRYRRVLVGVTSYQSPSRFIADAWKEYSDHYKMNKSVNGIMFEFMVYEVLKREGVLPFYPQAGSSI